MCSAIDSWGPMPRGAVDDDPDMTGARARTRSRPRSAWQSGRALRAAAFTLFGSVLAVVGHHLASDDPVPWPRLTVGAVALFALSLPAARPDRRGPYVFAATGLAQLLLHRALSVGHGGPHGHAGAHVGAPAPAAGPATRHAAWAMTATHCVAACVMALLMHRADRALSRLPETLGRWAQEAVAAAVAGFDVCRRPGVRPRPRTVRVVLDGPAVRPTVTTMLGHAVVRRGPPAGGAGDVPLIPAGRSPAR